MGYVTIGELADELGLDKSNIRKTLLKNGFAPVRIRTPETKGQLTLALTQEEAEAFRELRESQGFGHWQPTNNGKGEFYVVQVIPEFIPNRVKLGFADDAKNRLAAHRTAAPTATLCKAWPCKRVWEAAAIDSLTRIGCKLIANEVFECDNLEALLERGDDFFALMPKS